MGGTAAAHELVHAEILRRMGQYGKELPNVCGQVLDEVLRSWPTRHMTAVAIRSGTDAAAKDAIEALAVISARVRETLEAVHGCDKNTMNALTLLVDTISVEFANLWFASTTEGRKTLRQAIAQAANSRRT